MTGTFPLPLLRQPIPRPVDPEWKCQRSGECCTKPAEVVMTRQERMQILRNMPADSRIPTEWRDVDEKFVALKAKPCPFFIFNGCVVYANRPYNCRRFSCMRPDPKSEAWDGHNMMDRYLTSRVARRILEKIQRKSQRWAYKMGWIDHEEAPVPVPAAGTPSIGSDSRLVTP